MEDGKALSIVAGIAAIFIGAVELFVGREAPAPGTLPPVRSQFFTAAPALARRRYANPRAGRGCHAAAAVGVRPSPRLTRLLGPGRLAVGFSCGLAASPPAERAGGGWCQLAAGSSRGARGVELATFTRRS